MSDARGLGGKDARVRRDAALRSALAAVLAVALGLGCGCSSSSAGDASTDSAEASTADVQVDKQADGILSFTLEPEGDVSGLEMQVLVDGKTDGGEEVHDYYKALVGTKYALQYGAGSYALSVVEGTLRQDDVVYKATDASVVFDAQSNQAVELRISKDTEATDALAAQKQKEAEEAAAKKAAEEAAAQKKAEEEAAAQKAAAEEAARKAEEEAAQKKAAEEAAAEEQRQKESASVEAQERTVYITNTGKKYHNGNCRHLKKSKIAISLSDAVAKGYTACKTCGG